MVSIGTGFDSLPHHSTPPLAAMAGGSCLGVQDAMSYERGLANERDHQ